MPIYAYNKAAITHDVYLVTINFNNFKNKITEHQSKFIIVPIDKANNYAFVCKIKLRL